MTDQEQIMQLAEKAWGREHEIFWFDDDGIERFAELVAAAEREQCAKHYLGIMRDAVEQAVLREREACAKLVEEVGRQTAAAIRARGDKHE